MFSNSFTSEKRNWNWDSVGFCWFRFQLTHHLEEEKKYFDGTTIVCGSIQWRRLTYQTDSIIAYLPWYFFGRSGNGRYFVFVHTLKTSPSLNQLTHSPKHTHTHTHTHTHCMITKGKSVCMLLRHSRRLSEADPVAWPQATNMWLSICLFIIIISSIQVSVSHFLMYQ